MNFAEDPICACIAVWASKDQFEELEKCASMISFGVKLHDTRVTYKLDAVDKNLNQLASKGPLLLTPHVADHPLGPDLSIGWSDVTRLQS